jgi:hypothetical protein
MRMIALQFHFIIQPAENPNSAAISGSSRFSDTCSEGSKFRSPKFRGQQQFPQVPDTHSSSGQPSFLRLDTWVSRNGGLGVQKWVVQDQEAWWRVLGSIQWMSRVCKFPADNNKFPSQVPDTHSSSGHPSSSAVGYWQVWGSFNGCPEFVSRVSRMSRVCLFWVLSNGCPEFGKRRKDALSGGKRRKDARSLAKS